MVYYIIEHPSRGTLRDWEPVDQTFRFSRSGLRNDPDTAYPFFSVAEAKRILMQMPTPLRNNCKVLRSPDEGEVEWTPMFVSFQGVRDDG